MEFNIIVSTIDGSQGDQHTFYILDLEVYRESRYPMGFTTYHRRQKGLIYSVEDFDDGIVHLDGDDAVPGLVFIGRNRRIDNGERIMVIRVDESD